MAERVLYTSICHGILVLYNSNRHRHVKVIFRLFWDVKSSFLQGGFFHGPHLKLRAEDKKRRAATDAARGPDQNTSETNDDDANFYGSFLSSGTTICSQISAEFSPLRPL